MGGNYEFDLTKEDVRKLARGRLEADLVEMTKVIKTVTLSMGKAPQEAHLSVYPPGSCWEDASRIDIKVRPEYIKEAEAKGTSSPKCNAGRIKIFVK
jgi:hypothetical protein